MKITLTNLTHLDHMELPLMLSVCNDFSVFIDPITDCNDDDVKIFFRNEQFVFTRSEIKSKWV